MPIPRQFHVEPSRDGGGARGGAWTALVAAWDGPPVGHHETLETVVRAQDVGQKVGVLSAVGAVDLVVGRHHAGHAAVLDDHLEVPRVDLAQGLFVHGGVVGRSLFLDIVGRVVFHTGPDVLLDAGDAGRAHASKKEGVFTVGFLRAPPQRVAKDVHGGGQEHGLFGRHHLIAQGLADAEFEIHVERGASGHSDRERGGIRVRGAGRVDRSVQVDPARTVAEGIALDASGRVVHLAKDVVPVSVCVRTWIRSAHLLGHFGGRHVGHHAGGLGRELGVVGILVGRHLGGIERQGVSRVIARRLGDRAAAVASRGATGAAVAACAAAAVVPAQAPARATVAAATRAACSTFVGGSAGARSAAGPARTVPARTVPARTVPARTAAAAAPAQKTAAAAATRTTVAACARTAAAVSTRAAAISAGATVPAAVASAAAAARSRLCGRLASNCRSTQQNDGQGRVSREGRLMLIHVKLSEVGGGHGEEPLTCES